MLKDSFPENSPCILVEGPRWSDAKFYGEWLIAAAEANSLCKKAFADDDFDYFCTWTLGYKPNFGHTAFNLMARLFENSASFVVPLEEWYGVAEFVIMIQMGFCVRTGQRYQMVIPTALTMTKFEQAARKLILAQDDECDLHFEELVETMPYAEAKAWRARLRAMDRDQRCADRNLLLEATNDTGTASGAISLGG